MSVGMISFRARPTVGEKGPNATKYYSV
jgi:hypothetical protein